MKNLFTICALAALVAAGCGNSKPEKKVNPNLPTSMILSAKPADAKSVTAIKDSAKPGDDVTITGIVGGKKDNVLGNKAAIMFIMDEGIGLSCAPNSDCGCKTPWDYCCSPQNVIARNIATVKFMKDGKVITGNCENFAGLKPFSRVFIKGKVNKLENGGLTVIADKIFVEQIPMKELTSMYRKPAGKKGHGHKHEHKHKHCSGGCKH